MFMCKCTNCIKKTVASATKKWAEYAIEVNSDILADIKKYSPIKK